MIITKKSFFNNRNPVSFSPSIFVNRNSTTQVIRDVEYTYGRVAGKYMVDGETTEINYMSGSFEVVRSGGDQ